LATYTCRGKHFSLISRGVNDEEKKVLLQSTTELLLRRNGIRAGDASETTECATLIKNGFLFENKVLEVCPKVSQAYYYIDIK